MTGLLSLIHKNVYAWYLQENKSNFIDPYYSKLHQIIFGSFSQTPWFNIN